MELFKFNYDTDQTVLERGEVINNLNSIMWVERYRDPGEFQIVAELSTGLRDFLPEGTLISHADTLEVMIVENHEIGETEDEDPLITVSGRSFESILENRIVGVNEARAELVFEEVELADNYSWIQARNLINNHISTPPDSDDVLTNVVATSTVAGTGVSEKRVIPRGTVHQRVLELLEIDDLGVKTIRRNTFGVSGSSTETRIVIHEGVDRSGSIIFSWEAGDLAQVNYLFSGKKRKNTALVQGHWINVVIDKGPTKYDRRMMLVDGNDIDERFEVAPTGDALTRVIERLTTRGNQALRRQQRVTISSADISDVSKYRYRRDYNVGDWVMLDGNFGTLAKMRVTEYAEIEDENGESGHPTLELPEVEE